MAMKRQMNRDMMVGKTMSKGIAKFCKCSHTQGNHKRVTRTSNYIITELPREECLWDECNCEKFDG